MAKTIDDMINEVTENKFGFDRDNVGYSGMHVGNVIPSIKRTAIAYQTEGSNWNRAAPSSSGISYSQGTRVYNGSKDLVIKPHQQWRCGANRFNDRPENNYQLVSFIELDGGLYELTLSNRYGEERLVVDFEKGEVHRE